MPTYKEIDPSPQPEFYENQRGQLHFRAKRWVVCDTTELGSVVSYFLSEAGSVYPHTTGYGALVRRVKPIPRGKIGGTATLSTYPEAIVELTYDTDGPRWVSGLYVDEMIVGEQLYIRPPGFQGLTWQDGRKLTSTEIGTAIPVRGATHILNVGRSNTYPTDALTYMGMVNSGTKSCSTLAYSFAAGTVLYGVPRVSSHTDYVSGTKYEYTYRHTINPFGWNNFWNAETGTWEALKLPGGSNYVQYTAGW